MSWTRVGLPRGGVFRQTAALEECAEWRSLVVLAKVAHIPEADGGRFIIFLPSDEDSDITYIPCDLVAAPSFLRMAKRPASEGRVAFYSIT